MTEKISLNDPNRLSILCQSKSTRSKRSLNDVGALAVDPTRIPDPILREDALEDDEQEALFIWARKWEGRIPVLRLLHMIPNGARTPSSYNQAGKRTSKEGAKLVRMGLKRGVPDVSLPVPTGIFHGCYVELKRRIQSKSTTSDEQKTWIADLRANGYRAEIVYGWEQARDVILDYLGVKLADLA